MGPDAVDIDVEYAGLREHFMQVCPRVADLKVAERVVTTTPANWKVIVDNYMECYHCAPAHPSFSQSVTTDGYTHSLHGRWACSAAPPNPATAATPSTARPPTRLSTATGCGPA